MNSLYLHNLELSKRTEANVLSLSAPPAEERVDSFESYGSAYDKKTAHQICWLNAAFSYYYMMLSI